MMRLSVVAMAFVLSSALGPIGMVRADGQIHACVNNSSGEIKLVAQNATCKNNETLVVWNSAGSGAAGIRSGAEAFCTAGAAGVPPAAPLQFERYVEFGGSDISANGLVVTSFVLQPGVYQVHLSADELILPASSGNPAIVQLFVNGVPLSSALPLAVPQGVMAGPGIWRTNTSFDGVRTQIATFFGTWTLSGDHLLPVSSPNTSVQLITDSQMSFPNSCRLVITRLSDGPVRFPGP